MVQVYAHRGFSSRRPENTLSAFAAAVQEGVDGIELDVHLTKDGQLAILHDETMDRTTTGTGWVKDVTMAELKEAMIKDTCPKETIPTLDEVLELLRGTHVYVNIELKNNVIAYPRLEEKVIAAVERHTMERQVILSSFNHVSLYHLHRYCPEIALAVLYDREISEVWVYAQHIGAIAIHPEHSLVTAEGVIRCHQHGIAVRPYTVDKIEQMRQLIHFGVDGIITNVPDRLKEILAG